MAQNAQSGPNMTPNGPKWPQMAQEWPKMTQMAQQLPKMAQNYPKMAQKWRPDLSTFSAIFFKWKGGSANFFAFRMYVCRRES